jgi:hypothetical protein
MDLRLQVVDHEDLVPVFEQDVNYVGADKAGASGYQYLHYHSS